MNRIPATVLHGALNFPGVRPGELAALPPPAPTDRRLQEMAAAAGVLLAPVWYSLEFDSGLSQEEQTLQIDALEGPFICTSILAPLQIDGAIDWEFTLQSGSRRLVEGRVRGLDALYVPYIVACDGVLAGPVVVNRGDSLKVGLVQPTTGNVIENTGLVFCGFAVRSVDGARVGDIADAFAARVRDEGEFYAVGVVANGQDSVNVSSPMLVETIVVDADADSSGFVSASTLRLQLGNHDVFPQSLSALASQDVLSAPIASPQLNVRWPVRAGQRLTIVPQYPAITAPDAPATVRACILGRRAAV